MAPSRANPCTVTRRSEPWLSELMPTDGTTRADLQLEPKWLRLAAAGDFPDTLASDNECARILYSRAIVIGVGDDS